MLCGGTMNEILFRGKTPDGEWKKGLVVGAIKGKPNFLREFGKDGFGYFDWYIISDTVGQDTGYSDKNSKKLFEDDIFVGLLGYRYVVSYYPEHAAFMARCIETNRVDYLSAFKQSNITVIGNIHDNPLI